MQRKSIPQPGFRYFPFEMFLLQTYVIEKSYVIFHIHLKVALVRLKVRNLLITEQGSGDRSEEVLLKSELRIEGDSC